MTGPCPGSFPAFMGGMTGGLHQCIHLQKCMAYEAELNNVDMCDRPSWGTMRKSPSALQKLQSVMEVLAAYMCMAYPCLLAGLHTTAPRYKLITHRKICVLHIWDAANFVRHGTSVQAPDNRAPALVASRLVA